jgi:hypothetical protein
MRDGSVMCTEELASLAPWRKLLQPVEVRGAPMLSATGFCPDMLAAHQASVLSRQMVVEDRLQPLPSSQQVATPTSVWGRSMAANTTLAEDPIVCAFLGKRPVQDQRRPTVSELTGLTTQPLKQILKPSPYSMRLPAHRFQTLAAPTRFVAGYEDSAQLAEERANAKALVDEIERDVPMRIPKLLG